MLRRSAAAVAAVIVVIVLPYLLTVAVPLLPPGPADWLLRVTPAAGFAVQQTLIQYPQVSNVYTPSAGYCRWPRGPASRCCAPGPRSPWRWPRTCCAGGTHDRGPCDAEWTKLRTLPGTVWLLLAVAALTVAVGSAPRPR